MLTTRQTRLYVQRVTVWRPTETRTAAGKVTGRTWSAAATGVPCYLQASPSQFELQGQMTQSEGDNVFTLDKFHFAANADIRPDDVLEVTTGHAALLGGFWQLRGDREPHTYYANKQVFVASRLAQAPSGIA